VSHPPPASYATREHAAAYVRRVLARSPAVSPAPVYVIVSPSLMRAEAWPKLLGAVRGLLPGCELLGYADVFTPAEQAEGVPVADRVKRIVSAARGAVVLARVSATNSPTGGPRYLIGYSARLEAEGLLAAGLPVLVLVPGGLVAWPDVRTHPAEAPVSVHNPIELVVPAPPREGVVLATVAASYRALGLPRPRPWRPPRPPRPRRPPASAQAE
jgi:hypothetical protein